MVSCPFSPALGELLILAGHHQERHARGSSRWRCAGRLFGGPKCQPEFGCMRKRVGAEEWRGRIWLVAQIARVTSHRKQEDTTCSMGRHRADSSPSNPLEGIARARSFADPSMPAPLLLSLHYSTAATTLLYCCHYTSPLLSHLRLVVMRSSGAGMGSRTRSLVEGS